MKKENNAIVITSIIAGVVLIIALLAMSTFSSFNPSPKDSVTVQGIAEVKAMPDVISVYFTISTEGDTSAEASDTNGVIYDDFVEALILEGFQEDDLKTENYNVYPNTYWSNGKQITDGYKATHSLRLGLSSEESDKISPIIDAGVNSGAGISYINFELSQELQNTYKAEALKLASEDATIKAGAVASGFDKEVKKLLSVQVSNFGYYPWNVYTSRSEAGATMEDSALAKESIANISPSEKEISASVTAVFRIG